MAAIAVVVGFGVSMIPIPASGQQTTPAGAMSVALTFDDGPHPTWTPAVLDILARYGARSTFFVTGSSARRFPDLVRRAVREGHSVQNHSYSHANLTRLSDAQLRDELEETSRAIEELTGKRPQCLRPPQGHTNERTESFARAAGMQTVLWTDDTRDWRRPGVASIVERATRARPGGVVLLHDGGGDRSQTVAALPQILEALGRRGLGFDTICDTPATTFLSCSPMARMGGTDRSAPVVYRRATGTWYWEARPGGLTFGAPGDVPCPLPSGPQGTDFPAVFRPSEGRWYTWDRPQGFSWGAPGDLPVTFVSHHRPQLRPGVFRPSDGCWFISDVNPQCVQFGGPGDLPVNADWNGDRQGDELGVFRPSNGTWYTQAFPHGVQFGGPGDIPVACQWNHDHLPDIAVFRPDDGRWYIDITRDGGANLAVTFGGPGDIPVPGDYDGDGVCDLAVFRPSDGTWYIDVTRNGHADRVVVFGGPGDVPLVRRGAGPA